MDSRNLTDCATPKRATLMKQHCCAPMIEMVNRAAFGGPRLGVFASSFNPVTIAHIELMRRALTEFSFDGVLAVAGRANADKHNYECALEDRLQMLGLAISDDARMSIGLS